MRASRFFPIIDTQEPVGLVIADGGLGDHVPRFSAFVWGPVPEDALDEAIDAPRVEATRVDASPVDATRADAVSVALC